MGASYALFYAARAIATGAHPVPTLAVAASFSLLGSGALVSWSKRLLLRGLRATQALDDV